MERRKTYLLRERMLTICSQLVGSQEEYFHFGSQSEGSTTPDLNSDIDLLIIDKRVNTMTDWRDWEAGMENFLMLHDAINPPQQYLLQVIHKHTPKPVTSIDDDRCVRKDSGQLLFSSERWKQDTEHLATIIAEVFNRYYFTTDYILFLTWDLFDILGYLEVYCVCFMLFMKWSFHFRV
ncbi:hypothetical protein DPMN_047108 [Dreissena polymorpha]|uniref:Polymerase nucleotidyl transferase domain-containing protein n=1 Tax=Dreissena polymorpha TaxID=45954 RepID=A0A9D4D842_DREPO|nr:hypothetical protein DPMN_047108 [Dreissena polymorpha]